MKFKSNFKLILLASFVMLLLSAFLTMNAQAPSLVQKIDDYLQQQQFQGTALVAKENNILFERGYGFANAEYEIANTPQTVYRIGSITKLFTAVAILQLQEEGLLSVQDPIQKYLPHYPKGDQITIHHLLCHASGIGEITNLPNFSEIKLYPSTPEKALVYFQDLPLRFKPGSDCEYSNSGYLLLGHLIEIVSHKHYEEYLQEHIFNPLRMNSTYYAYNSYIIPQRASGYVHNENGLLEHAGYIDMSLAHGSGGLASTVEDLLKFNRSLRETTILSSKSLSALFTTHAYNAARKCYFGYGIRIGPFNKDMENCQNSIVGHFGSIDGFEGASIQYLDDGLIIILLSNVEKADVRKFHKDLAAIVHSYWRASA